MPSKITSSLFWTTIFRKSSVSYTAILTLTQGKIHSLLPSQLLIQPAPRPISIDALCGTCCESSAMRSVVPFDTAVANADTVFFAISSRYFVIVDSVFRIVSPGPCVLVNNRGLNHVAYPRPSSAKGLWLKSTKHRPDQWQELVKSMMSKKEQYTQGRFRIYVKTRNNMRCTGDNDSGSGRRSRGR